MVVKLEAESTFFFCCRVLFKKIPYVLQFNRTNIYLFEYIYALVRIVFAYQLKWLSYRVLKQYPLTNKL